VTAGPNAANATVTFPNMTATDNFTPEPTITCTGNFVGSPRVFLAKEAASQTGVFPVSATATSVSCTPRDADGNAGTAVAFTVTVGCQTGFAITAGSCKGEHGVLGVCMGWGDKHISLRRRPAFSCMSLGARLASV
jgi:hypothetical protein